MNKKSCGPILVVEDEHDIRETLKSLLEFEGYSVLTATNGKEAIQVLDTMERPCLILLDLMMPVMSGMEFLQIKNSNDAYSRIPTVVVSAVADTKSLRGALHALRKPPDLDKLLAFVSDFCEHSSSA